MYLKKEELIQHLEGKVQEILNLTQILNLIGTYGKAGGDDTMFIVSCLRKKLKIFSSTKNLGTVYYEKSTWFNNLDEKFFFDKGALFTAINRHFRFILCFQFLLRHKEFLSNISFGKAYKAMINGSEDYIKNIKL